MTDTIIKKMCPAIIAHRYDSCLDNVITKVYYYFLDWHLGNYIKDPEELQYVQTLTQTVFKNYIGNACAKNLTTNPQLLVPDLLKVAVLRSLNMSNGEIAEHMDISLYYVRKYSEELAFCTDNANKEELREIVRKMKLIM